MLDNELDDIIRKAAGQHNPGKNAGNWEAMHSLLDKHLPQKRHGRKRYAAALLFISAAFITSAILLLNNKGTNKQEQMAAIENIQSYTSIKSANPVLAANASVDEKNVTTGMVFSENNFQPATDIGDFQPAVFQSTGKLKMKITPGLAFADEMNNQEENNIPESVEAFNTNTLKEEKQLLEPEQAINPAADISKTETVQTSASKKKPRNPLKNVGFSFGLGPDISFVNISKPLSSGISVGGGVSYALTPRLSVHTGVYLSNKIYIADSASYHPPASFWGNYPNLQKISGSATVFEFPVSASFNILKKEKHTVFINAGASSYLVKKESYTYNYKNALGQPDKSNYTIREKEKYNFSVITLSAGLQTKPNGRVSYKAEPFIKLPLSGIGFGKMNLKSMGVMFGIQVNPFAKKD